MAFESWSRSVSVLARKVWNRLSWRFSKCGCAGLGTMCASFVSLGVTAIGVSRCLPLNDDWSASAVAMVIPRTSRCSERFERHGLGPWPGFGGLIALFRAEGESIFSGSPALFIARLLGLLRGLLGRVVVTVV